MVILLKGNLGTTSHHQSLTMALRLVFLVVAAVALARGEKNLLEEATRLGATTVIDLLKSVGLDKSLETDYLTLFLPTNEAFAALPDDLSKTLAGNQSLLQGVLLFHATKGIFRAQDAVEDMLINTELPGSQIRVNTYDDANNAVYITLNGAKVVQANVVCSNGIIHIIDRVMLPPLGNFYDLVSRSEAHKTLKSMIDGLGFKQLLETTPGTLFAPTDTAFTELFADLAAAGIQSDPTGLPARETVLYHLLPKVLYSAGAKNGTYTTMDKGESLMVSMAADGMSAMINLANVVVPDVPATNGVLHIIDRVLTPKAYRLPMATTVVG